MAYAPAYLRAQSFSDWQIANPNVVFNGVDLDSEFNRIKATTDKLRSNLALIQRADGTLGMQVVGVDQLSTAVVNLIGQYQPKGNWATASVYAVRDLVGQGGASYVCAAAHTSGTFNTDLAAGKWVAISQASGTIAAGAVSYTPSGDIAATDVQDAIDELEAEKQPLALNLTEMAALTGAADRIPFFSDASNLSLLPVTAIGKTLLNLADKAAGRAAIDAVTSPATPTENTLVAWDAGTRTAKSVPAGSTIGHVLTHVGPGMLPVFQAITFPPSSGEANDGVNVGTGGKNVFKTKSGVNLQFRQLKPGAVSFTRAAGDAGQPIIALNSGTLTFTENADDITVTLNINYTSDIIGGGP